jgi:hypothetical protein
MSRSGILVGFFQGSLKKKKKKCCQNKHADLKKKKIWPVRPWIRPITMLIQKSLFQGKKMSFTEVTFFQNKKRIRNTLYMEFLTNKNTIKIQFNFFHKPEIVSV